MLFRRFVLPLAAGACLMLCGPTALRAQADAPVVKNASLVFVTAEDGKDETTVLTIAVTNAGGVFLDRVFDAKQEIKPGTTFNLWLQRARPETADKLTGSKVSFRIDPKGDEHWVVKDVKLQVNFESGPSRSWHWGPFVLETKASKPFTVEYALTDDRKL